MTCHLRKRPKFRRLRFLSTRPSKNSIRIVNFLKLAAYSLDQALEALGQDREFLKEGGVFTDDVIDGYIDLKSEEVERLRLATNPVEFDLYYSV